MYFLVIIDVNVFTFLFFYSFVFVKWLFLNRLCGSRRPDTVNQSINQSEFFNVHAKIAIAITKTTGNAEKKRGQEEQ